MPRRKLLLAVVVIVCSFFVMTYQSKSRLSVSGTALSDALNASHSATTSIYDFLKRPFELMALRGEENVQLKKQVATLLFETSRLREVETENRRLRELLGLRDQQPNQVASARIIARGVDYWSHTLIVDKGTSDGVQKDFTAITAKGLVGKITSASGSYARLLLLTDINFSAAVRLQEGRSEAVLSGTGGRKCTLKYVPYEEDVKAGDIVITSGLDALFPAGIPVGYISQVDKQGRGGDFEYIEVMPFQDAGKVEEVLIVR